MSFMLKNISSLLFYLRSLHSFEATVRFRNVPLQLMTCRWNLVRPELPEDIQAAGTCQQSPICGQRHPKGYHCVLFIYEGSDGTCHHYSCIAKLFLSNADIHYCKGLKKSCRGLCRVHGLGVTHGNNFFLIVFCFKDTMLLVVGLVSQINNLSTSFLLWANVYSELIQEVLCWCYNLHAI